MNSCFSGGWLVEPRVKNRKHLNVTGTAALGPNKEMQSWSLSKGAGRACGNSIAMAILNQVIQVEEDEELDQDPRAHTTYIELAVLIYDKATSMDTFFVDQNVDFSAQDDDWEVHWRRRTGTPLTKLKDR